MKTNTKYIKIFAIFVTLIIFLSLFLLFEKNYSRIVQILDTDIEAILESNPILIIFCFFIIMGIFNVGFLPGKTIFITISAFLINNFAYAFGLTFGMDIFWAFLSYPLLSYFKNSLECVLNVIDKKLYKILKINSKDHPWKTCYMIQTLTVPQTYKNIILISFDIKLFHFVVSKLSTGFFYIGMLVIMGMSLKSLKDLTDSGQKHSNTNVVILTVVMISGSILLCIAVFCYIKREYNRFVAENKDFLENNQLDIKESLNEGKIMNLEEDLEKDLCEKVLKNESLCKNELDNSKDLLISDKA